VKQAGVTQVKVPVGTDWGSGAYIVATLRRPLDAPAQRMPGRAIGVQWFSIDRAAKTLTVDLKPPALLRPNTTLHIPVKIDGLKPGDEARIAVAAVDVGILNLTNYKPPSPNDYYLGQRALATEIRDLYGDLIDGMQGTRGQIRTGGDAGAALQGNPPTGPPLSFFSGDWGGVLDCEVLAVEPNRTLSYTWDFAHDDAAFNLKSVVTFTLTPTSTGTRLRMEQSGFRPDQRQAFGGAQAGWPQFFAKLEQLLARTG